MAVANKITFAAWIDEELSVKAWTRFDFLWLRFGGVIEEITEDLPVDAIEAGLAAIEAARQDSPLTGKEAERLTHIGKTAMDAAFQAPIVAWVKMICDEADANEKAIA